jgi:hypothetical protein
MKALLRETEYPAQVGLLPVAYRTSLFPTSSVVHCTTADELVMEVTVGGEVIWGAVVSGTAPVVLKTNSADGFGPFPAASVEPARK